MSKSSKSQRKRAHRRAKRGLPLVAHLEDDNLVVLYRALRGRAARAVRSEVRRRLAPAERAKYGL